MTRLVAVMFGPMLDARARRILEETRLDWLHEVRTAETYAARVVCHARAMASMVRALASIVAHDVAEAPRSGVWIRAGVILVVTFIFWWRLSYGPCCPRVSARSIG